MSILYVLIPLSLVLVAFACWAFFWAVGSGQFDELESPAWDVLREEGVETSSGDASSRV
jgi:cbb3-type cytochrome oxidase maturation protein